MIKASVVKGLNITNKFLTATLSYNEINTINFNSENNFPTKLTCGIIRDIEFVQLPRSAYLTLIELLMPGAH